MIYAILSMVFAGVTAILAKYGMQTINADLGLVIRTSIIFILVIVAAFWTKSFSDIPQLTRNQVFFLLASGVTAFFSWLFYFRALKDGPVTYVASIDKASIVVTLVLAFILLKEPLKPQVVVGGVLVLAGMLVLVWK